MCRLGLPSISLMILFPILLQEELDRQVLALLGPKTAEDEKPPEKKKKEKKVLSSCITIVVSALFACPLTSVPAGQLELLCFFLFPHAC